MKRRVSKKQKAEALRADARDKKRRRGRHDWAWQLYIQLEVRAQLKAHGHAFIPYRWFGNTQGYITVKETA